MATICRIKSNNSEIKLFLNNWIEPLNENLDASRDQFLASVLENFGKNQLGLKLLQKRLNQSNININVLDLIPENLHQTHEKFKDWELKSPESEILIFGTNAGLNRFIKHKFAVDAYRYCIVDTTKGVSSPLVESKELLIENIAKFKLDLIQRLLPYAIRYDSELLDYIGETIFSFEFGADGNIYDKVMNAMKKRLEESEINLNTIDVTDPQYKNIAEIVSDIFSLINFDYLLDELMKGIIEKSPKSLYGDLNRTEYNLMLTPDSELQDLQGISDQQYENALNYITPDINKIVSDIPIVSYSLKGDGNRFKLSESGATLQLPHILQLSHWLQLYLPQLQRLFKLEGLDFQARPVYTVKTILKALHDSIENYSYRNTSKEIKLFLKTKNIRSAIQTGMSVYEYLFNNKNRIDPFTTSIQDINLRYEGVPRFNIINEICQQIVQTTAPAFIEHTKIGTIFNSERGLEDSIGENFIQRFEHSKARFSFLNPMTRCLITEGLKEKSDIANILVKYSGSTLKAALDSSRYLTAIKKVLGIRDVDDNTVISLLIEADEENNGKLKSVFNNLGNLINSIKPNSDVYKYWEQAVNIIKTEVTNGLNYDVIGMVLGPLLNATPSPTFVSRDGNLLGVYRTTSLVFMFDHLRKRYKISSDEERKIIQTKTDYKPLRLRCNFFVDNPLVLTPDNNPNYLSTVAIPLSMGTEEVNLEARKLPEFIQDLHAFVGLYMSLMLSVKQKQATPMLALLLGTYSDKTTLPQLCVNGNTTLFGADKNKITFKKLLNNTDYLLRYTYTYSAINSLDTVNHIIEDWKEIFRRLLQNPPTYRGNEKTQDFINQSFNKRSKLGILIKLLLSSQSISQELISQKYSKEFEDAITYRSEFKNFETSTKLLKKTLDTNIAILNSILQLMPKEFLQEAIPLLALENKQLNLKGLKIVDIQYADKYENGYELNRMILDDLNRNCSFETYKNYCEEMTNSGLSKQYYIDGKLKSFEEYLHDWFTLNEAQIRQMISQQTDVADKVLIFSSLYDSKTLKEDQLKTIYQRYLILTNFLRHQALDLSVKEAYEDKAKNKKDIKSERSDRQQTTTKRNNTLTATVIPFLMDIVNGVSRKTKICVIEDIKGGVFNTIGIDRDVDEFDGLGFNSPIQVRMEDASLCKKHRVSTKKTFITPVNDYSAEELKWATNEITNKKIRESQGCQRNLLSIFKRMHNIPFDYDITRHWQNGGESTPIIISSFLGKQLYSREGFDYYRYDSIENVGKDTYIIVKTKVDPKTEEEIDLPVESYPIKINTIYDIYTAFNGINCKELTSNGLEDSENIMDFLYKMTWSVGEFIDPENAEDVDQTNIIQPLRDSFVGILATHSSNKRGASNIVTGEAWTNDNIPLSYTEIEIATGGEQLSAEHEADGSSITKGTLLMQDIAQKGYTSELVENVYNAIAKVMDQSSPDFDEIIELLKQENITGIQEKISEKIVKQLEITGTTEELQNLIAEFKRESEELGEPFILPLSMLIREVIKSYAPDLNKNVIKQKDSGLMGTLNGSSGFIQTYNIGDKSYTMSDFLSDKSISKFKSYKATIDKFCAETGIPFNEVIRCLSLLDLLGDLDSVSNYFAKAKEALYLKGDNPYIQKWLEVALNTLKNPTSRRTAAQTYFSVNPDATHFLGFEKISVSEVKPGETVINPNTYEAILIDSSKAILNLKESVESGSIQYVMLDKMTPVDLQASITSIETISGLKENEYTSYEAIIGARINRLKKGNGTNEDWEIITNLVNYLRSKNGIQYNSLYERIVNKLLTKDDFLELSRIQEDILNFKNHVKAFGYTLRMPESGDLAEYFNGFNPREYFESQLQAKIIEEDCPLIENGVLLDPKISNDEIRKALQFYYETRADENKKKSIELILTNEQTFENFIKEHPQFLFKILPYKKYTRYKEFFDSKPQFDKIIKSNISTAKIIMPAIYRGLMKLENMDLVDIDFNFFKKAPTFYKVDSNLINKDGSISVDFIVRTFRGQENIIVVDDLTDSELDKYGQTIPNQNIIIDEEGYRINPRTKEKLYKLPSNQQYIIKRNGKTETIILKNNQNVYSDIELMLVSDGALVSVQPFISNLIEIGDRGKTRHLLRTLNGINTIPSFERMYRKLDDFLSRSNLKPLISQLKIELGQDYITMQEDYENKYRNSMFISFLRSLDVIATRIPTQNMSSIMAMKVAAFTKSDINDVFVTKWQQWLQGADYDIDKAFILGYNFDEYGRFITWSPLLLTYNLDLFERSLRLPLPSGKTFENGYKFEISKTNKDPLMDQLVSEYVIVQGILYSPNNYSQNVLKIADDYNIKLTGNPEIDFLKLKLEILINILNRVNQVNGLYISEKHNGNQYVVDLVNQINIHNSAKRSAEGYKNYATYQMHRIMNDPRNATTAYKSIDIATDAFNNPIGEITENELIIYNLDDGHTISSITVSGAVGKDDVGIGANGTKAQFTILNYLNREFDVNEPLNIDELENSHYFNIIRLDLEYENKEKNEDHGEIVHWEANIGPISDTIISNGVRRLYEQLLDGEQLYLYNRDASLDVGALLSMAADNAKTLNLDKMHAETDYFAMHIFLAMIGCPPDIIIKYFRSPAFMEVIHRAQNDLAKGKIPLITYETFISIAKEYEGKPEHSAFIQLAEIFACAKELTAFALILSINQGIKVEEQELVGQKQKLERAYRDTLSQRGIFAQTYLMTKEGYFNDLATNAISDRFLLFGSLSLKLIQHRMRKANAAMQLAGITLQDPFNLNRFKHDKVYAEAIKCVFDVVKHNYNIFDIIDKAPHFSKMLEKYNQLMQVYSAGNAIINYEVNQAPIDYDKNIIAVEKGNPQEGEYGDNIVLSETYTKKQTNAAKAACNLTMFQEFLKQVVSNSEFKYSKKTGKESISIKCNFNSDEALHKFIDFVNLVLIPKLFELNPDNRFLEGLEINNQEAETNNNVFFSFGENLRVLQNAEMSGITRLHLIKQAFKEIKDIKLIDLLEGEDFKILDSDTTVGDFLFIYNTIMKLVNPRGYDFGSLFTEFNPRDMKTRYYRFTRDYDTKKKELKIDKHLLMACVVRSQIKMKKYGEIGIKLVEFTDGSNPIVLSKMENGRYHTNLVLGMPLANVIDSYIELADLFKDAILSKKLQFIEINPNCE